MKTNRLILLISFFSLFGAAGYAQQITATYSTSAPEAGLFFLDPGILNPAFGSGAMGMFSNPAGLRTTNGRQFSVAFSAPSTSTGDFSIPLIDESEVYEPIRVKTRMEIEETGGFTGIAYAHQFDQWRVGLGILQPSRGGIRFQARGNTDVSTAFDFEKAITREMMQDLPVEELPILWDVETRADLSFSSSPTDLYLAIQPIKAGVSYNSKRFSIGAGLTYYRIFSSEQSGRLTTRFSSQNRITGSPYGINPQTGDPWTGSVTARLDLDDEPLTAVYEFDVRGRRLEFGFGGMFNTKLLSLGVAYANGMRGSITGEYNITTISTKGLPREEMFSDIHLEFENNGSRVDGSVSLQMHNFAKDTMNVYDSGSLDVGGYHSFSIGAKLFFLGAFVHTKIPKTYPDIMSTHFGVYSDFKLPWLPVRVNAGFIQCMDGLGNSIDQMTPYRITTHVGGGVALQLPVYKWIHIGEHPSWLRLGIRSSLINYAMDIVERDANQAYDEDMPSPLENISVSLGLDVPF